MIGLDAMTEYYDVNLKKSRHNILNNIPEYKGYVGFVQDKNLLKKIFKEHKPNVLIHLAAQAGVRYSIEQPNSYVESNLIGTFDILEIARNFKLDHLLIASTSSVYGSNIDMPFNENQKCDTPMSFYAATKKANEVMAHSYSHLFNIPTTIFRFFTVYGPWGRPDMALFKFTKNILSGNPIDVYNFGKMKRDFTYVDDLTEAIRLLIPMIPSQLDDNKEEINFDSISNVAPFRIVNIGNSQPIDLIDFINELERVLGIKAKKNFLPMQDGDVAETNSNIKLLEKLTGYRPRTKLKDGVLEFVNWYKAYHSIF